MIVIAETGRIPVDNPATHLELTMIHEAMVLEYAGPDLPGGVGSAVKELLYLTLLVDLFLPVGIATSAAPAACWWASSRGSAKCSCSQSPSRSWKAPTRSCVCSGSGTRVDFSGSRVSGAGDPIPVSPADDRKCADSLRRRDVGERLPHGRSEGALHDDPSLWPAVPLLAVVATTMAISESRHELFVTAALTVVLKTILIPWFLMRTVDRIGIQREIEPFLNVPVSLLICLGLTVVGYQSARASRGLPAGHASSHRRGAVAALDWDVSDGDAEEGHHADPGAADCGERGLPGGRGCDHRHAAGRRIRDRLRRDPCRPRPRHSCSAYRRPVRIHGRQPALKLEG